MPKSFQIAQKLTAVIHEAEEGGYWAEVPALRGCYSQGDTLAETKANIREAAEGWLEVRAEQEAETKLRRLPKGARAVQIAVSV